MGKLLIVKDMVTSLTWMKHLPNPLVPKQKVVVANNQEDVEPNYIRVKHGNGAVSVFNKLYFSSFGK